MGVNLQNVNKIIHYGAPQSLDDFFQESGRGDEVEMQLS